MVTLASPRARRRVVPALLLLGLAARSAAAADPRPRPLDLWPIVVRDTRPVAGLQRTRIAGPFFERWTRAADDAESQSSGWTLRPWLARLEHPDGDADLEFLYPLGKLRWRSDRTRFRLSPIFDRTLRHIDAGSDAEPDAGPDAEPGAEPDSEHWTLGPVFGGRTAAGERYGGVFPLAGRAKQRFGREQIDFLLFPLFGRSRDARGFVRTHVLWPLFSFGSGGGRSVLRIWPFYGHDRRDGEWERRFALWPLVFWRTERPGQPGESRSRFFLPFYGETRTDHSRAFFVAGPLYWRADDWRTGARSTSVLWPLFRAAQRPAREGVGAASELRIEPFLRIRRGPEGVRTSALFGAFDVLRGEHEGVRVERLRLGFVNRFERREDTATGASWLRRDLWPLFSYRAHRPAEPDAAAHARLRAPWLLPLAGEGFERHALGLTTLYEHRRAGDESRSDWLFGLARRRETPDYRLDAVSWLFRRERSRGDDERLELFGLPLRRPAR